MRSVTRLALTCAIVAGILAVLAATAAAAGEPASANARAAFFADSGAHRLAVLPAKTSAASFADSGAHRPAFGITKLKAAFYADSGIYGPTARAPKPAFFADSGANPLALANADNRACAVSAIPRSDREQAC